MQRGDVQYLNLLDTFVRLHLEHVEKSIETGNLPAVDYPPHLGTAPIPCFASSIVQCLLFRFLY